MTTDYCTRDDLEKRFGTEEVLQLTDRDNDGVADTDVLNAVLADVNGQVDAYLAGRYHLPLTSVPVVLTRMACDMARYYLYDDAAIDQVVKRFDAAIDFLKSVSKGQVSLGLSTLGGESHTNDNPEINSIGNDFARRGTW